MAAHQEFFLPHDMIVNILKRLPVKSLVRFRCVCKDWNDLFKTSFFIEEHLHHSTHHRDPSLLLQWNHIERPHQAHIGLLNSDKKTLIPLNPPSTIAIRILGSSNGIVCIHQVIIDSFMLWNPATKEVRRVPNIINNFKGHCCRVGFGFSKFVNDYKIVKIHGSLNERRYHVNIYSLSTGSWSTSNLDHLGDIKVLPCFVATDQAIYWPAHRNGFEHINNGSFILSFDTAKQVFALIPRPIRNCSYGNRSLITYENKLGLISWFHLYVMEEATSSSGESVQRWNATTCIDGSSIWNLEPMTFWMNELVLRLARNVWQKPLLHIYIYNLTTCRIEKFLVAQEYYGYVQDAFNYVESLMPIGNTNSRLDSTK